MPSSTWVRLSSLSEVECFLALADQLHFRKAAEVLNIPQPHLSRTIRRLEKRLGVALFERTSRRVELTPAGLVFAEEGRALWAAVERTSRRVQLAGSGAAGTLSVGFSPWAALHGLPEHVTSFRSRFPDVQLDLIEDRPAQLCNRLQGRSLDVAYVRPVDRPGLRFHHLATESYCVVVPVSHRLARLDTVPLGRLHDEPFVSISRRGDDLYSYDVLAEPLTIAGVELRIMVEVPSAVAAVAFVRAGAGFSLMTSVHQTLAPDLAFVPLEHPTPAIQLAIASRRHEVNPIVDTFLRHVSKGDDQATG